MIDFWPNPAVITESKLESVSYLSHYILSIKQEGCAGWQVSSLLSGFKALDFVTVVHVICLIDDSESSGFRLSSIEFSIYNSIIFF